MRERSGVKCSASSTSSGCVGAKNTYKPYKLVKSGLKFNRTCSRGHCACVPSSISQKKVANEKSDTDFSGQIRKCTISPSANSVQYYTETSDKTVQISF